MERDKLSWTRGCSAQWQEISLLCRLEDLRLDAQHQSENPDVSMLTSTSSSGGTEIERFQSSPGDT